MTEPQPPDSPPVFSARTATAHVTRRTWSLLANADWPHVIPESFVRAVIALSWVGTMLWMQWHSPDNGKVPAEIVSVAGVAAGYFLTTDASPSMKAILSLIFALALPAFLLYWGWVPDAVLSQVSVVTGIWFGRKRNGAGAAADPNTQPKAVKEASNG